MFKNHLLAVCYLVLLLFSVAITSVSGRTIYRESTTIRIDKTNIVSVPFVCPKGKFRAHRHKCRDIVEIWE